jgi:hypothetical protein
MAFIENDDVVETVSAYRPDKALNIGILPRRPGCRENFLDGEALNTTAEVVAVDTVAVAHQVLGRRVLGECLNDLLGGPVRAGVAGDVPVQDAPAVVGEDEKDVEDAKSRGGHGEEVDRGERTDMVVEESAPGLEGGLRALGGMKRETLRSPMSMPSLSNSPWILGAPHDVLALAI